MRFQLLAAASVFASASYLAVGCASPPAPLPEGAWVLTFTHPGATCNINNHNTMVGTIDASSASKLVTEGTAGAEVICSVTKNGGGFDVTGHVLAQGANLEIDVKGLTASASQTAPVQGVASYISPQTQNVFTASAAHPCNFYFADPAEKVGPGSVFVSFDCPEVDFGTQACGISAAHIKMINCDGSVAM